MTTSSQNIAAAMGLGLIFANALNSAQRAAFRTFITGPAGGRTGTTDPGSTSSGASGTLTKILHDGMGFPDIPGIPQGPITGIPFSPIVYRHPISPLLPTQTLSA